jgi:hypothetical protein
MVTGADSGAAAVLLNVGTLAGEANQLASGQSRSIEFRLSQLRRGRRGRGVRVKMGYYLCNYQYDYYYLVPEE